MEKSCFKCILSLDVSHRFGHSNFTSFKKISKFKDFYEFYNTNDYNLL